MSGRLSVSLVLVALVACDDAAVVTPGPETLRSQGQAAIYGEDDRTDWYAETDESLRQLAYGSIVAMVDSDNVDVDDPSNVEIDGQTLGRSYYLCNDERFYDQISAASCSGTLIDDDLVLTAGHCVNDSGCGSNRWVFRYLYEAEGELGPLTTDDVYACSDVLVRRLSNSRDGNWDYAIVRLDRPATPRHQPAEFALPLAAVSVGDPVTIIGFGSGLPMKIDDGGRVTSSRSNTLDYFEATTDSFGGNSGSGVFNAAHQVVGILVRGQQDYSYRRGCGEATEFPEDGSSDGSEGISYAAQAVNDLCESGWPSVRLCGTEAVCGDSICSPREECEADCSSVCGDGACEDDEVDSCDEDCAPPEPEVPDGWACEADAYDSRDGCDCDCGVWDPDCDVPRQAVNNCESGQICVEPGECADEEPPAPEVPEGWFCDPSFYGEGDGCDCGCGAWDIDCDNAALEVFNCAAGETCIEPGVCGGTDAGGPDGGPVDGPDAGFDGSGDGLGGILNGGNGGGGSGCASTGGAAGGPVSLALLALAAVSRRRRSVP